MSLSPKELRLPVGDSGETSAILLRPPKARAMLALAHGAGAGMRHPFMETLAQEFSAAGFATSRYQFLYMDQKRRVPDSPALLTTVVRAAGEAAAQYAKKLPLFAGGKSLGARMTSTAASERPLANVRGLVFFGFPLHAPSRPGTERAAHLSRVSVPMLFLQGTKDQFAQLDLLRPVIAKLGPLATLRTIEGADHSFHVPKKSGRSDAQIIQELVQTTVTWSESLLQ